MWVLLLLFQVVISRGTSINVGAMKQLLGKYLIKEPVKSKSNICGQSDLHFHHPNVSECPAEKIIGRVFPGEQHHIHSYS